MALGGGALFDPTPEDCLVAFWQSGGMVSYDFFPKKGLFGAVLNSDRGDSRGEVESEPALGVVLTMAGEAVASEKGADVLIEGDLFGHIGVASPRVFFPTRGKREK